MRKYLFLSTQEGYRWGGSEPLWSTAAERLVRGGSQVRVSVRRWRTPVPQVERLGDAGCRVFYRECGVSPLPKRAIRKLLRRDYTLEHLRKLGDGVDLVVISQGANFEGLPWMEAARRTGLKYAVIAQSAVVYWWPADDDAERLANGYEHAEAAYFVSQAILDLSRLQFGSPLSKAKVVRNPFNVRYETAPAWPDDSREEVLLACVGRLDVVSKAQDVLLQVLALPHWRERSVRVSLVGEGPHERVLRRMAERLELRNVEFTGHLENVEELWKRHRALVLPSRFEGMPLTLVEAMLCGRPCVVTDVGGNKELVRDGINGFLAKAPTVELLDEAMSRLWESRERLQEMGVVAARDARRFVSADPGADFARELETLAGARELAAPAEQNRVGSHA